MKTVLERFVEVLDRRLVSSGGAPIVVAYSGGGDSMALLHLAKEWWRTHDRRLLALTVDHGVHPESLRWTASAGAVAHELHVKWQAVGWEGDKPSTGLQAKARVARHTLLAEAARRHGARVILMAHTADDVAEGELMRATDAPGLGRLREWAPSPAWPEGRGVFILRPLLTVGRAELRRYLTGKDAVWLDDPANEDRRFARVRARQVLGAAHPREGGDPGFFAPCGAGAAQASVPASAGMSGIGADEVAFDEGGATAPSSIPKAALAALLLCVSGGTRPPRSADLDRMMTVIAQGGVTTLSGCRIEARGGRIRVARAPPRRGQPPRPAEPVGWVAWRFHAACGLYPDEGSIPPV